jgi:hypothetical protein
MLNSGNNKNFVVNDGFFSIYFICYHNEMFRIKVTVRGNSKSCAFLGRYEVPCYWQNDTTRLTVTDADICGVEMCVLQS